jgi:hypothetical protein
MVLQTAIRRILYMHNRFRHALQRFGHQAFTIAATVALFELGSCDSLWGSFTGNAPNSCNPNPSVCPAPQVCNFSTGTCADPASLPLGLTDIAPRTIPMQGGTAVFSGTGFSTETTVKVAGYGLISPSVDEAKGQISGMIPRSQGLCGAVDVEISKPGFSSVRQANALSYVINPFRYGSESLLTNVNFQITRILTGNIDGDPANRPDLLLRTVGPAVVITNNGAGSVASMPLTTTGLPNPIDHIALARIAGKTRPDIVVADSTANKSVYFVSFNETANQYNTPLVMSVTKPVRMLLTGDIDHDGTDEVIVLGTDSMTSVNSDINVIYRSGNIWSRNDPSTVNIPIMPGSAAMADVNNDNLDDLVIASLNTPEVFFVGWVGRTGSIVTTSIQTPNLVIKAVVATDWNGDQKTDLAFLSSAANTLFVATNQPGQWRGESISVNLSGNQTSPLELLATDITCDARPEIIINQMAANTLLLLVNDGTGRFPIQPTGMQSPGGPLAIANFNNDNLPDFVVGKPGPGAQASLLMIPAIF